MSSSPTHIWFKLGVKYRPNPISQLSLMCQIIYTIVRLYMRTVHGQLPLYQICNQKEQCFNSHFNSLVFRLLVIILIISINESLLAIPL